MTLADALYATWAALVAAALVLWALSRRVTAGVGRPSALVAALVRRPWVRAAVVAGWVWVGVHTFAR